MYLGEVIAVQGTVQVDVEYNQQHVKLPSFIVKGNGPSLFGHNWLSKICKRFTESRVELLEKNARLGTWVHCTIFMQSSMLAHL